MRQQRLTDIPSWMLFAFPVAIAVPTIAGVVLGGPIVGFLAAGLIAGVIVAIAIRMAPAEQAPHEAGGQGWRGAAARRFLVPFALGAVGVVLIAATTGVVRVIGWGVLAVAVTVAMSLVFLEIGYSEERAREREERGARRRGRDRPVP